MISTIIALALTFGTPSIKTAPAQQPALHTKTIVYNLTKKKK